MDEVSTNIQQLPITMLEAIISDLNIDEQVVLTNVNKYLNSIASPILYKDILFDYYFYGDANVNYKMEDLIEKMSNLNRNDPLDAVKVAECDRDLLEVYKEEDKYRQKVWSELEPAIKKHYKFIVGSQCINPKNLINELENYSNLKRYKITIDTQEGMDQLINYKGDSFKLMESLELFAESELNYEVEDLFLHLHHLKELRTNMRFFHEDLKLSRFSSNILTYLYLNDYGIFSTKFLYNINTNFKNLKTFGINLRCIIWDSSLTELPIFENLVYFKFDIFDFYTKVDIRILNYMINPKYFPKLIKLSGRSNCSHGLVCFEGQWDDLPTLDATYIDSTSLIQLDNFYQLKSLNLEIHPETESKILQTIFINLTNLLILNLNGKISSQHFNFLPQNRLLKLSIYNLNDFSQTFVNFLKAFVAIQQLWLYFTDNAFEGVNLNSLLEEKHKFPKLKEACLDNLPEKLQDWFSYSL